MSSPNPTPTPTPTPIPTIQDAISAVETSITNLANADSSQQQAQARYDAALVAKNSADVSDVDATIAYNASLQQLITAATAAMRPVSIDQPKP